MDVDATTRIGTTDSAEQVDVDGDANGTLEVLDEVRHTCHCSVAALH